MKGKQAKQKKISKAIRRAIKQEQVSCIASAMRLADCYGAMGFQHKPGEAAGAMAVAKAIAKRAGYVISHRSHAVQSVMSIGAVYGEPGEWYGQKGKGKNHGRN